MKLYLIIFHTKDKRTGETDVDYIYFMSKEEYVLDEASEIIERSFNTQFATIMKAIPVEETIEVNAGTVFISFKEYI